MARIIFAGYLVRYPLGGYAWQMGHYLLGFHALGHDTWFYEDTGELNCDFAYNPLTNEFAPSYEYGVTATAKFFSKIGFGDRWVFSDVDRGLNYGPGANRIQALLRESDLLVSFGPLNRIPIELFRGRPSIFIDPDPVYMQLKLAKGDRSLAAILDAHTFHFTFGENIGKPTSILPTAGYTWHPTRQPVAMDIWENAGPPGLAYTTVGKWDSTGRDIDYLGESFTWRKRTEWRQFLDLLTEPQGLLNWQWTSKVYLEISNCSLRRAGTSLIPSRSQSILGDIVIICVVHAANSQSRKT